MKKLTTLLTSVAIASSSLAQPAPHTLTMINQASPGSGPDAILNAYTKCFNANNVQIVKEFKAGAGGLLAINRLNEVTDSPTNTNVLVGGFGMTAFGEFPGIDTLTDIVPVAYMGKIDMVVVAKSGEPVTMESLVALSKTRPINVGVIGSISPFMAKELFDGLKIPYTPIPYKSAVTSLVDTASGVLDVTVNTYQDSLPMMQANKIQIVVSTLPVKDAAALGHKSISAYNKKLGDMPMGVILNVKPSASATGKQLVIDMINACNKDADTIDKLKAIHSGPVTKTPAEIAEMVKAARK